MMLFLMNFSSALAYMARPYSEAIYMCSSMTYTPCDASLRGKTGDIITFTQLEEGDLFSENCNNAERSEKSYDNSIMPPLPRKEEMDAIDYVNE